MDKYFAAKRLLFDGTVYPAPRVAVINALDPSAEELAAAARKAGAEIRTYGMWHRGDWRAANFTLTPAGAEIALETPAGSALVSSGLAGEVNILNLLAALTAAHARGIAFADLVAAVPSSSRCRDVFSRSHAGQPFTVIVDYAHTDDALRNLIALARQITGPKESGTRVITVFGCGGDRDRTKRPKMGQAAGEGSDFVVATSDNPRSEDPRAILAEIEPGLRPPASNTWWNQIASRPSASRSRQPRPAMWFCLLAKATKKNRSSRIAPSLLTMLKYRFPSWTKWIIVGGKIPKPATDRGPLKPSTVHRSRLQFELNACGSGHWRGRHA